MTVVLSALRSELVSDPGSFGYAALGGNYNGMVGLLNSVSANAGKSVASTVTVGTVYAIQMQQCVVPGEYAVLNAVQRDLWGTVITTALNGIAVSNSVIRSQITTIWSAGLSGTRQNLIALQDRAASRCEVLFGEGEAVDVGQVTYALEGVV